MKPLIFHDEAKDEIEEAAAYLEEQREGLAAKFRGEIDKALARIQKTPKALPLHGITGYRKCILREFSYTIYFYEFDDHIWIVSVAHQKRRPEYWMDRASE